MKGREKKCIVGGEILDADNKYSNTEIGVVCPRCFPAYEGAKMEYSESSDWIFSNNPGGRRRFIKDLLDDPDFVISYIKKDLSDRFMNLLESDKKALSNGRVLVRKFRKYLMEGLDFNRFVREEKDEHGGLDATRALACINEEGRTMPFFYGIANAIKDLEMQKNEAGDSNPLEIIDAGTGPLPIFAMLAAVVSDNARITAIEINEASYKFAKKVIERFGLQDRIKIIFTDATKYTHDCEVDLLISETMYAGLINEPLVQILDNFLAQLSDIAAIIPQSVTVKAGVVEKDFVPSFPRQHFPSVYAPFEVLKMTRDNIKDASKIFFEFSPINLSPGSYNLFVGSDVEVYKGDFLGELASVINSPTKFGHDFEISPGLKGRIKIKCSYPAGGGDDDVVIEIEEE